MKWQETFIYQGKALYYNRVEYNNHAERAVEIPLAYNFLKSPAKILEIGNVLANYEKYYEDKIGLKSRRIVDKYEVAPGVDNVDLMDLPDEEKYEVIVSISTVEHVGQSQERNQKEYVDFEAPLKAIAKIYQLLEIGGKALITVPFGKLLDGGWYIQFSQEYLHLLSKKYQIPEEAISCQYLKRIGSEIRSKNPHQLWIETEESLSQVEYCWPYPNGNGIAVIELKKNSRPFSINHHLPQDNLNYSLPIFDTLSLELLQETYDILERLREINLVIFPDWSDLGDDLYQQLRQVIQSILAHRDQKYLALLIDTHKIDSEAAELILSGILMDILTVENLETTDEPEIILLEKLASYQWQGILPNIQARVLLKAEDELAIELAAATGIPSWTVESISNKRFSQLATGMWIFD